MTDQLTADIDPGAFHSVDFFTDETVTISDPYPFYEYLRSRGTVSWEPHHGVAIVTGHAEALEVYRNTDVYSACNASTGPFYGLTAEPGADDIKDLIDTYRAQSSLRFMNFMDPPTNEKYRVLMARLFTPRRLQENEQFMWRMADEQLDTFVSKGSCEFIHDFSQPFTIMIIADLLGVPEADREELHHLIAAAPPTGAIGEQGTDAASSTALIMPDDVFIRYIEDRRREPRDDVLTHLALGNFPDGSTPEIADVAREAAFLFVAGGETTARLLGFVLRYLADHPELQQQLRGDRVLIPKFSEEMLRLEAPVKAHFRMTRRPTSLGGVELPAGTTVMLLIAAVNRDARRFADPHELRCNRKNAQEHITFGRGTHSCLGQFLARAETRISVERIVDRMRDIRISDEKHGPPDARRFDYDPSFIFRGIRQLHLEFTPA